MIDGWVTGAVDRRPRITTKGDAQAMAVKPRVANGIGPTIYTNAFASDDEPLEAIGWAWCGDHVDHATSTHARACAGATNGEE
ncbi:hypothetical protein [Burkholderia sp. BE17]|uniref:hypothetical protein n=1 Tax=Burkholderia sp. BE17 TaxID=2656644 RepID=UPI00128B5F72|nr:hypothetical protein [Burkholderia sp. BE17]MPV65853.1 hypothetical protein [Burkholderia sp. BE17]